MSKAQAAATSSHKSSSPAAALVRTKDTLSFMLHPKQLVAFRSKATEILYRGAAGGGKPHLMRPPCAGCYPSTWLAVCYPGLAGGTLRAGQRLDSEQRRRVLSHLVVVARFHRR